MKRLKEIYQTLDKNIRKDRKNDITHQTKIESQRMKVM